MLRNPTKNGSPENHRKLMLAGTQNDPKMNQISMFFPIKTPKCIQNVALLTVMFFCDFLDCVFSCFSQFSIPKWVPDQKKLQSFSVIFSTFFVIVRFQGFFSDFGWFPMPRTTKNDQKAWKTQWEKMTKILPKASPRDPNLLYMGGRWLRLCRLNSL